MKKVARLLSVRTLLGAMVQCAGAQSPAGSASSDDKTVASVTKMERDWETAMHNKDDAAVGKILADGWFGVNPDGSSEGKSQFLSEVKKGDYAWVKLDSVDVKSFGNTAVATGKASDPKLGTVGLYGRVHAARGIVEGSRLAAHTAAACEVTHPSESALSLGRSLFSGVFWGTHGITTDTPAKKVESAYAVPRIRRV